MITLYLFSEIAIALATFDTLAECHHAEQRIAAQEWYAEFRTLCVEEGK